MNAAHLVRFASAALAGVLIAACAALPPPPAPPAPAGATNMQRGASNDDAVFRISDARCALEQTCGNVGAQGSYPSRDACLAQLERNEEEELGIDQCPGGIDEAELTACVAKVHAERCGNASDTESRLDACRAATLCSR